MAGAGVSASAIEAGRAVVRFMADDSHLRSSLQRLSVELKAWGSRISNLGRSMMIAGAAGAALFVKPIQEAAKVEQLMQRFSAVFGRYADAAGNFADQLARRVNNSRLAIRDQLAQYQAYLQGIGFDQGVAASMSQALVQLTQDWIAFDDTIVNGQEAMDLFLSALSGEVRPARRMGADLRVAALNSDLLNRGLEDTVEKMTEVERVTLRFERITAALTRSGVIGQAEREVNTAAAQIRGFLAALRDLAVAIGNTILPVFNKMTRSIIAFTREIENIALSGRSVFPQMAEWTVKVIALGVAFEVLGRALTTAGKAVALFKTISGAKFILGSPVAAAVTATTAAVAALGTAMVVAAEDNKSLGFEVGRAWRTVRDGFLEAAKALAQADFARALEIALLSVEKAFIDVTSRFQTLQMIGWSFWETMKSGIELVRAAIGSLVQQLEYAALAMEMLGTLIPSYDVLVDRMLARSKQIEERLKALRTEIQKAEEPKKVPLEERFAGFLTGVLGEQELDKETKKLSKEWEDFTNLLAQSRKELGGVNDVANMLEAALLGNNAAAQRFQQVIEGVNDPLDLQRHIVDDIAIAQEAMALNMGRGVQDLTKSEQIMLRWRALQRMSGAVVPPGADPEQVRLQAKVNLAKLQAEMTALERIEKLRKIFERYVGKRSGITGQFEWSPEMLRSAASAVNMKRFAVLEGYMVWDKFREVRNIIQHAWTGMMRQRQMGSWEMFVEKQMKPGRPLAEVWKAAFSWAMPESQRRWATMAGFSAGGMTQQAFQIGETLDVQKKSLLTLEGIKEFLWQIMQNDGAIVSIQR